MNTQYLRCAAGILILLALALPAARAQEHSDSAFFDGPFSYSNLLFQPLLANHIEPRAGFILHGDGNALRGDIGSSIDIARFRLDSTANPAQMSIGADFFTWTALRRLPTFHFPVDAIDYLFGVNLSYRRPLNADLAIE